MMIVNNDCELGLLAFVIKKSPSYLANLSNLLNLLKT